MSSSLHPIGARSDRIAKVGFRARTLVSSLESIVRGDYPREAKELAALLAALTTHIADEIDHILEGQVGEDEAQRAKGLFQILQQFYKYVEYLRASESRWSPPSVQELLSSYVEEHFDGQHGRFVALVRPQWIYNLQYYPLLAELRSYLRLETFDRSNRLGLDLDQLYPLLNSDQDEYDRAVASQIVRRAWQRYRADRSDDAEGAASLPESPADEIGILSFAGLDTSDTFQFSILSHELAHFLHLSQENEDHKSAISELWVDQETVEAAMPAGMDYAQLEFCWKHINGRIAVSVREIVADLVATRMLGLGFVLAQMELLLSLADWPENQILSSGYPGISYRLHLALEELERMATAVGAPVLPTASKTEEENDLTSLSQYLGQLGERAKEALAEPFRLDRCHGFLLSNPAIESVANTLAVQAVEGGLPRIEEIASTLLPNDRLRPLEQTFYDRLRALRNGLPPFVEGDGSTSFGHIMAAGWARVLLDSDDFSKGSASLDAYQRDCRLLLKALELAASGSTRTAETSDAADAPTVAPGAVLSRAEILARCRREYDDPERITIMPLATDAVQSASLDLRLGQWFKVARRTRLPAIDLTTLRGREAATRLAHDEFFLPLQKSLTIHPGDFVLAVTFEYVAIPTDLMATVEGRSGAGRTGLTIATATPVGPGFKGSIVLELAHAGAVPITIKPGLGVAQMLFYRLTSPAPPYAGRFQCQTRP